jgi:hypothetical protein
MTPEEALKHALGAEIARIPEEFRDSLASQLDSMVADHLAGRPNPNLGVLMGFSSIGSPDYQPESDDDRALQEQMLQGYTGKSWTPEQVKSFEFREDRKPTAYEMSPGGQMHDSIEERQRLIGDLARAGKGGIAQPSRQGWFFETSPGAWTGTPNPDIERQVAAGNYEQSIGRTKAAAWNDLGNAFSNPGNWLGNLATKTLGVGPDIGSQLATARNTGTNQSEVLGDVAARRAGADWNISYPQLSKDQGWRQNDALVNQMRGAWRQSEGQSAGDTFRSWTGDYLPESWKGKIPYLQPAINAGMSFFNGLLDGSTLATGGVSGLVKAGAVRAAKSGVPGISQYAKSVADDIARASTARRTAQEIGDEMLDPTQLAASAAELMIPDPDETKPEFQKRTAEQAAQRKTAVKTLESNQQMLATPPTFFQKTVEPTSKAVGGFLGNLLQ